MHKTAQQLIREAYEAANGLPPASAALLKELASRLDISMAATSQACDERSSAINTLTATRVNSECPQGVDVQEWVKRIYAENKSLRSEVMAWAKECDRIVERHTKTRSNMHVLEAMRDLKSISTTATSNAEAV
ncbi:hypothetical protein [Raoultella ornithinolytica]|uniref:hypothetical protein n=1 Tax=Raoultella ornithinolytica TaxID=54291 RepID=UPI0015DC03B3|nr:hypothetical protein [Raoultella ornithinolytica]BBQ88712.1 hypothetical protein WP3W18E06_18400 [Raoultella ornithinolytica]HAU5002372.1 hypothetical protein [Raoultella ornithinolytica]HDX8627213.1 hypothetical protein [Klebsiella michiganensis]